MDGKFYITSRNVVAVNFEHCPANETELNEWYCTKIKRIDRQIFWRKKKPENFIVGLINDRRRRV